MSKLLENLNAEQFAAVSLPPQAALILAGAGVGGGSLNYANTLYVPPDPFFNDRQWSHITDWRAELMPHYDQATRMLGVVKNPTLTDADRAKLDQAEKITDAIVEPAYAVLSDAERSALLDGLKAVQTALAG